MALNVSFTNVNTIKIYASKVGKQTITITSKNQKYSKTFEEQELLDDTKYILFGLFEKFGATQPQKEREPIPTKIKNIFLNSIKNKLPLLN